MRQKVFVGIESQTRTMFDALLLDVRTALSSANSLNIVSQALNLKLQGFRTREGYRNGLNSVPPQLSCITVLTARA